MMKHLHTRLAFATCLGLFAADGMPASTNIAEILERTERPHAPEVPFRLTGTILDDPSAGAFLCDASAVIVYCLNDLGTFRTGDRVRIDGISTNHTFRATAVTPLGRGAPPPPDEVTVRDIQRGLCANRFVTLQGTVIDAFRDDIDSRFLYIVLRAGNATCYIAVSLEGGRDLLGRRLFGAKIRVTGVCRSPVNAQRPYAGCVVRSLKCRPIEILDPPVTDPSLLPELEVPPHASPQEISELGLRRISGVVEAVLADHSFVLRDGNGRLHRIASDIGQAQPAVSDIVVAGGGVRTDFYLINLTHAIHSILGRSTEPLPSPEDVHAEAILHSDRLNKGMHPVFYGKTVRLRGRVVLPHVNAPGAGLLYLEDESHTVPVDIAATGLVPESFPVGTELSVTGVCLMDIENWTPSVPFCRIRGFSLVARTADDIRIISRPPWWTPGRFAIALGATFAVLLVFLVWNQILRRHIERRTKELLDERMAHARSEFRTAERTSLAIELHDTLSQDLAAVACQIDATGSLLESDPGAAARTLETLGTMLLSCRTELKRCLWDLRNETLEDTDLTHAIRRTLQTLTGDCDLTVRFNVPRDCLTDSSAHAVLSIVRELVSNARTHGRARSVKVAGTLDGDTIRFSVTDDGCGFDPANRPGPDTGHFGLAGVEARVKRLNGTMSLSSARGKGTRVVLILRLSEPQKP